ncbi:uncharacterized protein LOC126361402 isoform X2 [Schistocerca gregaria]|uniref:uncharacterized protein LOC126361402 isoform X2 n=1 Tax=Schistocerca gregaria TaxID=7010 RepID=UPI00211E3C16|nr:uncharacterized protein LOC126361402 isoform X2 [Schistocerca gregaria]
MIDASRPEEILITSMKNIHLDEANKGNNMDVDIADASVPSPEARSRQFKQCGDEERLSVLQEAQASSKKLKTGQRMRQHVREMTPYDWSCQRRLRKTLEEAAVSRREERHKAKDLHQAVPPSRPAANGYSGRASIWAPGGFNPLLDLSHLLNSPEWQQDGA